MENIWKRQQGLILRRNSFRTKGAVFNKLQSAASSWGSFRYLRCCMRLDEISLMPFFDRESSITSPQLRGSFRYPQCYMHLWCRFLIESPHLSFKSGLVFSLELWIEGGHVDLWPATIFQVGVQMAPEFEFDILQYFIILIIYWSIILIIYCYYWQYWEYW